MENQNDDDDDDKRVAFRKELSELTFEQLIELKQKLGEKIYNETVKGKTSKPKSDFSRSNRNRPREASSKIPVKPLSLTTVIPVSDTKVMPRDPRFDDSCGEFNEKVFNKSYGFIKNVRKKEKKQLIRQLNNETDEEKAKEMKFLIQRIENKEREERRKIAKEKKDIAEKTARKQAVKDGKKPYFYKKSDKKLMDLVDSYESLKKSGKLMKHIERKHKRNKAKDLKNRKF